MVYDYNMSGIIPIEVVPYDPRWPAHFERASRALMAAIGVYISTIEHIGSTAVPGLAAKPVIDILIAVNSLDDAPAFLPLLAPLGYTYIQRHEAVFPERRYLHRIARGRHTHHLHIVEPASNFFRTQLLFRDYLRSHPEAVAQYSALKYQLAEKYHYDREAYTDAKSGFIQHILLLAENDSLQT